MNPFIVAALLGFKHALDPDHIAAVFNMSLIGKMKSKQAFKTGASWGIGHSISMILLGLPVILFSAALPAAVYTGAEFLIGAVIIYLGLKLFWKWFQGKFHPHELIELSKGQENHSHKHSKTGLMGLLHGVGGSYPAALLMLASFGSPLAASAGLIAFTCLSILSMALVTASFSFAATHHKAIHLMDRLLIPIFIVVTVWFGFGYMEEAWQSLGS